MNEGNGTNEIDAGNAAAPTWPIPRLVGTAVLPGLASLAVFVPVAKLLAGNGTPVMVALFVAVLLGEVPTSWILMIRGVRREGRQVSVDSLFPWRNRVGWLRGLLVGVPLAIGGMVIVFGLEPAIGGAIRGAAFGWVPDWMVLASGPEGMAGMSRGGLIALWVLSGVVGVGIGGVTQELFHRGFLLPRAGWLGWWAVPLNGATFAVLHLASPWGWPLFFMVGALWAAAVYRWRSVQIGLIGHVGMLAIGWVMMTLITFGVVAPPG